MLKLSMPENKTRLVYSTEQNLPKKEKPAERDIRQMNAPAQQKVYLRLDRKGRGGKSVTLIEGLQMSSKDSEALLKQLKARLGTGGAMKITVFEIQGDHRDAIMAFLEGLGYRPKRAGG
jgi:translation initiation factor 1